MTQDVEEDLLRPEMDEVLIHVAHAMAARATCSYLHVGAIVAREGRILTSGYNGAPAGMPHCDHAPRVPGEPVTPCTTAVHAEANAVAFAARYGTALDGGTMYTTVSPCVACAQLIINSGINRVVTDSLYRDETGWNMLLLANVRCNLL